MNENAIELVRSVIAEDHHVTIQEIADTYGLVNTTIHRIIHDKLRMKKVCTKWVPYLLTHVQKMERVTCAKKMLAMFEPQGPKRLTDIVAGDETFIYFNGMPSKQANVLLVDEGGDRSVVVKPETHSKKRLFT